MELLMENKEKVMDNYLLKILCHVALIYAISSINHTI